MKQYIAALAMAACFLSGTARSFEAGGVCFSVLEGSEKACEVTYPSSSPYSGTVTIPASVVYEGVEYKVLRIGDYAFAGCADLQSVSLPATVATIGRNAFQSCTALTAITFPEAVASVEAQTFYGCSSLGVFQGHGVVRVGDTAFGGCSSLKEFAINDNAEYFAPRAFQGCSSMESFILPEDIELGQGVFSSCSSLKEAVLPSSLEIIPDYLFSECVSLKEMVLGANVVEIGANAFYTCRSLETVNLHGGILAKIGDNAFGLCGKLDIDTISGNSLTLGRGAFSGCSSLSSLHLQGVEEIGNECFSHDDNLSSISFDNALQKIDANAFRFCTNIATIRCFTQQPPYVENNSFPEVLYPRTVLEVIEGKAMLFRQTPPWSYFANVHEVYGSGVEEIRTDDGALTQAWASFGILTVKGPAGRLSVCDIAGGVLFEGQKEEGTLTLPLDYKGMIIVSLEDKSIKVLAR